MVATGAASAVKAVSSEGPQKDWAEGESLQSFTQDLEV